MIAALALLACLPSAARAQGRSLEIELVRPGFSHQGSTWVDHPAIRRGDLDLGVVGWYVRDPLVVKSQGEEVGAAVGRRHVLHTGAAYGLTNRVSLRAVLPLAGQWQTQTSDMGSDRIGVGDPSFGALVALATARRGRAQLGSRADLYLPLGTQDAWLGEGVPRVSLGALGSLDGDRWGLHADLGLMLRPERETDTTLWVGNEATLGTALRFSPWPRVHDLFVGAHARAAVLPLRDQPGNTPMELLLGTRLRPDDFLRLDVGVGKGLSSGYGTSDIRVWAGIQLGWQDLVPKARGDDEPVVAWVEPEVPVTVEAPEEPIEEVPWEEGQLARVTQARIEIRDPIQFRFDTSEILPGSKPLLHAVAAILEQTPQITHLVVEGHASEEGEHAYNYDLSLRRAQAILQALVDAGVHPLRLSCRAMGEVAPVAPGTDEASLARSRRARFLIAEQLDPLDPLPDLGETWRPWDLPAEVTP